MSSTDPAAWPALELDAWEPTRDTLHMWTQVVGKVRMALAPPLNHWWHTTLYVTARGMTTGPMPYGARAVEVEFDFIDHRLRIECSDGGETGFALRPMTTAEFYAAFMDGLRSVGVEVTIRTTPSEVENPVPFERDTTHAAYDPEYARRFWTVLRSSAAVMERWRGGFVGKCSPVHLFWGAFDLAVTRFSGRKAPPHPSVPGVPDFITREGYSHEVASAGFWPGGGTMRQAIYYAYAYPEPPGYRERTPRPAAASYSAEWGEFILPYDAVRLADDPEAALLAFLDSTYAVAADLGDWDRDGLERPLSPVAGANS
jgi:hypothetical protein